MGPDEGNRLKAFVVLTVGANTKKVRDELLGMIERDLSVPERPRALTFGDALPTDAMGKACDWPLETATKSAA